MKRLAILCMLAGLLAATMLVLSHGVSAIWHSMTLLGLDGFAAITGFHLLLIALMGSAWWLLGRDRSDARLVRYVWGRLVRDSAAETLPLSQVGGYVVGVRAVALAGISAVFAAASTVVDVTAELIAQLLYTLLGVVLLERLRPDNHYAGPILAGLIVMTVLATVFFAVQARGAGQAERLGRRFAAEFLGRELGESGGVQQAIAAIHARRGPLLLAASIHFASWVLSGAETWLTLHLMAVPISLPEALAVDSLLYGMRSVAFIVPNSIGVQEGALVLLGGLFGVGPDAALALSLVKRARDLAIGVPTLLAWQAIEGRRAWSQEVLLPATEESSTS